MHPAPNNPGNKPYSMRAEDAAKHIGISVNTLYRWAERGWIQPRRVGGVTLFVREELEKAVREAGAKEAA